MTDVALLPFAPLQAAVDARGGLAACGASRSMRDGAAIRRAYQRGKVRGSLTLDAADQLCLALIGEHPNEVWGDTWREALTVAVGDDLELHPAQDDSGGPAAPRPDDGPEHADGAAPVASGTPVGS